MDATVTSDILKYLEGYTVISSDKQSTNNENKSGINLKNTKDGEPLDESNDVSDAVHTKEMLSKSKNVNALSSADKKDVTDILAILEDDDESKDKTLKSYIPEPQGRKRKSNRIEIDQSNTKTLRSTKTIIQSNRDQIKPTTSNNNNTTKVLKKIEISNVVLDIAVVTSSNESSPSKTLIKSANDHVENLENKSEIKLNSENAGGKIIQKDGWTGVPYVLTTEVVSTNLNESTTNSEVKSISEQNNKTTGIETKDQDKRVSDNGIKEKETSKLEKATIKQHRQRKVKVKPIEPTKGIDNAKENTMALQNGKGQKLALDTSAGSPIPKKKSLPVTNVKLLNKVKQSPQKSQDKPQVAQRNTRGSKNVENNKTLNTIASVTSKNILESKKSRHSGTVLSIKSKIEKLQEKSVENRSESSNSPSQFLQMYNMIKVKNPKQIASRTAKLNSVKEALLQVDSEKNEQSKNKKETKQRCEDCGTQLSSSRAYASHKEKCESKMSKLNKILMNLSMPKSPEKTGSGASKSKEIPSITQRLESILLELNQSNPEILELGDEQNSKNKSSGSKLRKNLGEEAKDSKSPFRSLYGLYKGLNQEHLDIMLNAPRNERSLRSRSQERDVDVVDDSTSGNITSVPNEIIITTTISGNTIERKTLIRPKQNLTEDDVTCKIENMDKDTVNDTDSPKLPIIKKALKRIGKGRKINPLKKIVREDRAEILSSLLSSLIDNTQPKKSKKKRSLNKQSLKMNWQVEEAEPAIEESKSGDENVMETYPLSYDPEGIDDERFPPKSNVGFVPYVIQRPPPSSSGILSTNSIKDENIGKDSTITSKDVSPPTVSSPYSSLSDFLNRNMSEGTKNPTLGSSNTYLEGQNKASTNTSNESNATSTPYNKQNGLNLKPINTFNATPRKPVAILTPRRTLTEEQRKIRTEILEDIRKIEKRVWCEICKKTFANNGVLDIHYTSNLHKKNVDRSLFTKSFQKEEKAKQMLRAKRASKKKFFTSDVEECELLSVSEAATANKEANGVTESVVEEINVSEKTNNVNDNHDKLPTSEKKGKSNTSIENACGMCNVNYSSRNSLSRHYTSNMHKTAAIMLAKQLKQRGMLKTKSSP